MVRGDVVAAVAPGAVGGQLDHTDHLGCVQLVPLAGLGKLAGDPVPVALGGLTRPEPRLGSGVDNLVARHDSVAPLQWPRWAFLVDDLVAVRVAGERLAGVAKQQDDIVSSRAFLFGMHARVVLVGRGGDSGELTRRHPTVHVDGAAILPPSASHYVTSFPLVMSTVPSTGYSGRPPAMW